MVKVWLDAGHGGHDSGACGHGLAEKNIVLNLAIRLQWILGNRTDGHVEVGMTRSDDTFVSLNERANRANNWGADFFLSIHVNSGGGKGYEDYIYIGCGDYGSTARARDAFHMVMRDFYQSQGLGIHGAGKQKADFSVLRRTNMNAILTENLYIDNEHECDYLRQDQDGGFLDKLAWAHARALSRMLGFPLHEM